MSAINELKKFIKDHSVKNVEESFNEDDLPNEFEEDFEVCESKCAIDRKKFNKYLKSKGLKESKSLKESSSKEDKISKYVEDYFDNYSDAFREVVVDLIERVDDFENLDDSIYSAIDEGLIYNEDQWEVMKHYQVPSEADYDSAIEELTNDLYSICKSMLEDNEEDEDLEESYNSLHEDAVSIETELDRSLRYNHNALLVGSAGSATLEKVRTWAKKHNLNVVIKDCADLDEFSFTGTNVVDSKTKRVNRLGEFDELDEVPNSVLVLDNLDKLPRNVSGRVVRLVDKYHTIGITNSLSGFDRALQDRFKIINVDRYNSLHEDAVSDLKAFIKKHQIKEDVNEDDLPNEFEEDIEENELNEDASKKIAELKKQLKAFSKR